MNHSELTDKNQEIDRFYTSQLGPRWQTLRDALIKAPQKVKRQNQFAEVLLPGPFLWDRCQMDSDGFPPDKVVPGVLQYYVMDLASIFAANALQVQPDDVVLDMCAAPGGKSLILAEALDGTGELICNETSQPRRNRLKQILRMYIPDAHRGNLHVTGKDGARFGQIQPSYFDRILVDAPCSGERHLLHTPKEMSSWQEKRSRHLARRQVSLLCSAVDALKPGGRIVYSTCAVSNLENDEVVEQVLKKREEQVLIDEAKALIGEPTRFGWNIWPDQTGFGPIYFAVLSRSGKKRM